jgi:hypothetical protein
MKGTNIMFKIGQSVLYGRDGVITIHTITKVSKDYVWINNKHKPEDCFYPAFLYPNTEDSKVFLKDYYDMQLRHEQEKNEMHGRQFKLLNKQTLAGER